MMLRLVRKMNNMIGIFMQCVVDRIEEVYDIYMSILYDSMIITRLFILRLVTITTITKNDIKNSTTISHISIL